MAACRLAAKGRSFTDSSYQSEVEGIKAFLQLQRPAPAPAITPNCLGDIVPEDYVAPRFSKKLKGKVRYFEFILLLKILSHLINKNIFKIHS